MIKVEAYQASDGSLHKTEQTCTKHEIQLRINSQFEEMFNPDHNPFYMYGEIRLQDDLDVREFIKIFSESIRFILDGVVINE